MIIFLDCEYTDAIQCDLISIGMVSQDGQHSFYAERNDYEHGWCNSFVQTCILPLLDASNVVTRDELTAQLRAWFATLPRQVVIACDDHSDWDLFLDAFDGELPANVMRQFKNVRHLIDTTVFNDAVCCYHDQPKQPWHHALYDAKAHRAGWLAWMDAHKTGKVQGFINDEYAAEKNERRKEFGEQVKNGRAKATDASMFHGLAGEIKVKYKFEDFDDWKDHHVKNINKGKHHD